MHSQFFDHKLECRLKLGKLGILEKLEDLKIEECELKKAFVLLLTFTSLLFVACGFFAQNDEFILSDGKSSKQLSCQDLSISPRNNIVMLDETTHGSENIRSLNTCIVKYLVTNKNFNTIVLEWDFTDIYYLNRYTKNDPYISKSLIHGIFKKSLYDSESFFNLIEWVKKFNQKKVKVKFFGMDIWNYSKTVGLFYKLLSNNKNSEINSIEYCLTQNSRLTISRYQECQPKINKFISKNNTEISKNGTYILRILQRYLELKHTGIEESEKWNHTRDLNMFKTFEDIYEYQEKTQKEAKIVVLNHAAHGLNFKSRFGLYLRKANYNLSTYILSLCNGFISSLDINYKIFIVEIPSLDKNLLEYAICSKKAINKFNTNILFYPREFIPDHSREIPDFDFEGFFTGMWLAVEQFV